ncbi:MAG: putative Na+/H+ antiporter [candidate division Zixibacteria bacterium]|nr:putative Na+/H+ antiporter [candidate division Zixibacteria bacterium]
MHPTSIEIAGTVLFALALVHTFSTRFFERLARRQPRHAGAWHLLGEVEIVFGFWASVMMLFMLLFNGKTAVTEYLDSLAFTEPMFVFAIMVIAGTRPILRLASALVARLGRVIPHRGSAGMYFCALTIMPLFGSFITEPAAMTVAALTLQAAFFERGISTRFRYATLGILFVNVSIGGTLTPFAAPPVLMVASKWGWDLSFMLSTFGYKAVLAVIVNAFLVTLMFKRELRSINHELTDEMPRTPVIITAIHLLFLIGVVAFAHTPHAFMGIFLFFLGFTSAYTKYQDRLILREGLMVAFFLAGLVVIGGQQRWWLQPVLSSMSDSAVFFGAAGLTAFTDNAALTYLGSLVDNISESFKYALVAGAVVGGGLTVIANAPNPAGFSILRKHFPDEAISPALLALAALPPTLIALIAFWIL